MTVSSETSVAHHNTNGTTGPFAFTFEVDAASDLHVVQRDNITLVETELTKDAVSAGYTVSLTTSVPSAGSITLTDAYAAGGTITISRKASILQPDSYTNNSSLPGPSLTLTWDKLCRVLQGVKEMADRSAKIQQGSQGSSGVELWIDEANDDLVFVVAYASGATKVGTVALS